MSEINEDIIDDIGDIGDDTDLTGADEDELLLSDDESFSCRLSQEQEEDLLAGIQFDAEESAAAPSKPIESEPLAVTVSGDDTAPQSSITTSDTDAIEHAPAPSIPPTPDSVDAESAFVSTESDVVTSTNRDDEESLSQTANSQSEAKCDESEPCSSEKNVVASECDATERAFSNVESSDSHLEQQPVTSQEPPEDDGPNNGILDTDFDGDDDEDSRERRRNPKTCVEREMPQPAEPSNNRAGNNNKNFNNFQRGRNVRGSAPLLPLKPPLLPAGPGQMAGDMFNPAFGGGPQFRGGMRRMPGPQPEFFRGHPMMMMRGPPVPMGRMPMMQPNRMPMPAHGIGPPRMQRGPFQPQQNMGFGNNAMPPQGMMRPRAQGPNPHPLMRGQSPQFPPFPQPNHSGNMRHPMRPNLPLPPRGQPMNMMPPGQQQQQQQQQPQPQPQPLMPVGGPRKVLINPNFKGGVQAATNQLMMDTMKNSQKLENDREAELLRQQEAFINRNMMHIEKRRRSREYSPDRERSFSPPRRRERDTRKPHFRENRPRRARSGDRDFEPKRRRSDPDASADKKDPKTDEDEETRAYRLEIEKQKAMREKILRDKEMRRRKAAEVIRKEEEKSKPISDEPAKPLTPIIVTQKKIISLKKRPIEAPSSSDQASQPPKVPVNARKSQAPTRSNAGGRAADEVKQPRSLTIARKVRMLDDDDIDEDELLADSPPSTPLLKGRGESSAISSSTAFSNRRVIVRGANEASSTDSDRATSAGNAKRIFNRLDKKIIGVNETAKQKIQRIVINNND